MHKLTAISVGFLLFLASCSPYNAILKSNDYTLKLQKANEYYDAGKWIKASELYSQVMPVFKGTQEYEDLYYRNAYTQYNLGHYLAASYHFKNFSEFFPSSAKADECLYMHGVSLYKDAPRYSLDPTSTSRAREILVNYVNTHPGSPLIPEAMSYIKECTEKLETKDYNAALLYYNMGQYKASLVSFKELADNFTESKKIDYYNYMRLKSAYQYAVESYVSKQEERFVDAITIYREFKDFFPESSYKKDADKVFELAEKNIKQLRNEHQ